ncbi:unnamed protein product [Arctia plantaginis]|uniref:Peptidase aspartic putative domain-containing protein n=1 Tax=Arctia plantaginis TaxID=874455 RepID=A0A8S1B0K0_ARCPL|nr:unnamed protein product [Arctia plantaginis]
MKAESTHNQVILATARVVVTAGDGSTHELRALIDQGSQASFVTESTAQILNLKRVAIHGTVTGISNDTSVKIKSMVNIKLHSIYDNTQKIETQAYALSKITSLIPSQEVPMVPWPLLQNLSLADPYFQRPGTIDLLLGADVHATPIIEGLHRYNTLLAQNSRLGWLISGQASQDIQSASRSVVVNHMKLEIDQLLRKFWELEEHKGTRIQRTLTKEDIQCEEHFKNTNLRNSEGRNHSKRTSPHNSETLDPWPPVACTI